MSEEEMIAEPEAKKPKKERKRAPGAFAAFESKYHIVGNVLILVVCIALIAMCAFSNATFGIITLPDGSQAEVSQNMIQMSSAFTAFAMSDEELISYKTSADKLITTRQAICRITTAIRSRSETSQLRISKMTTYAQPTATVPPTSS